MADQNKNGNDLGIFALLFGAIFGVTYGAYKTLEGMGSNSEFKRMQKMVDEAFLKGMSEFDITNALMEVASKQMGDKFTDDVADRLKTWVLEEKIKLRKEGKI
jgi:hypothetical protein